MVDGEVNDPRELSPSLEKRPNWPPLTISPRDLAGRPNRVTAATHKSMLPRLLRRAYAISFPAGQTHAFSWPWVKDYGAEVIIKLLLAPDWAKYFWYDRGLKTSMGH